METHVDFSQISSVALIVLFSGFLQGAVAFGFGLLSVPLLLMVGLPVPTVLAVSSLCTAVQAASGVHHLRQAVPWKDVGVCLAIRVVAMLLGIWALLALVRFPMSQIKFWIGLVTLLLVVLQASWQPRPRARLHGCWNLAAFTASGFTGGLCAIGGPPLVLWVMAHDWDAERTRAFLFASFMSLVPFQLVVLYWTFGHDVLRGMILGAALSPVVLLGSVAGLRVGARFPKPLLRRLAFLVLAAIALNAMYPQVAHLLRGGHVP